MILAVDPGMATCGWAVIAPKTALVIDFGVITTDHDGAISKTVDRGRRIAGVSDELAGISARHGCTTIAGEQPLSHGATGAIVSQALCWGALLRLATEQGSRLLEVEAKVWQHAVQDGISPGRKKIDYPTIEKAIGKILGVRISKIPRTLQTHAFDAVGIGFLVAVRPASALVVLRAREESRAA